MSSKSSSVAALDPGLAVVGKGLATVEQAAKFLAISRAKVYELMASGELASAKLGKSRRLPWAAVKEFAARSLIS